MPTRMQQRGITSIKRPSPFASVGRQATTSTSILDNKNSRETRQNSVRPPVSTKSKRLNSLPPPVSSYDHGNSLKNHESPESSGALNNVQTNTSKLTEKITGLAEKGKLQKVEIDRQKLIISGLQRNLEHMTTSNRKDKQIIEELNMKIYQLKKREGQTSDLLYSPSSAKSMEQKHTQQIENLKIKFINDYNALEHKHDVNEKILKEAQHMNRMYNERIKQFEKDLLSKSSTEVTFKKQMETVSAHAKRMVDENRKLKDQLKSTINAKEEIQKLKLQIVESQNECTEYLKKLENLNYYNTEKNKKLEQCEHDIAMIKRAKESEVQRRKKAIKDLSAKSANLSQLKKEFDASNKVIADLKGRLHDFELLKKKEVDVLKKKNEMLNDDLNLTIKEKNELQETLNKMKQNYKILEISASRNSTKIPDIENRLQEMQRNYINMKMDRDLFSQQLDNLQRQQKKLVADYEKEKNILKNDNKLLKEQITSLQTGKSSDKTEYENQIQRLHNFLKSTKEEASRGIKNAQIQVDDIQNQCNDLSEQLKTQRNLTSSECERANDALKKLKHIEKERESELKQIAFLERQLEDQRASSANESRRAETALEEASRCRDRYENEHDRAQNLTGELSELRHAHLKLSEKYQEEKLLAGEKNDLHIRYEKERDVAQAALAELKNAMNELTTLYEKVQYESKEKDFLFQKKQDELHAIEQKYNELLHDAADSKENARLANKLKETEKELRNTLAKIIKTEEATESAFTCLKCMNIFDNPITCIPCGHSFCEKCVTQYNKQNPTTNNRKDKCCPECNDVKAAATKKVDYYIQNELLENLSSRFLFRKQAIESLNIMVGALK
eukprot:g9221.t1